MHQGLIHERGPTTTNAYNKQRRRRAHKLKPCRDLLRLPIGSESWPIQNHRGTAHPHTRTTTATTTTHATATTTHPITHRHNPPPPPPRSCNDWQSLNTCSQCRAWKCQRPMNRTLAVFQPFRRAISKLRVDQVEPNTLRAKEKHISRSALL